MNRQRLTQRTRRPRRAVDGNNPYPGSVNQPGRAFKEHDQYDNWEEVVNHPLPDMRHDWQNDERDDIGFGVPEAWGESPTVASLKVAANKAVRASVLLLGERVADEVVEDQARDLMLMGGEALDRTLARFQETQDLYKKADDEEEEEDSKEASDDSKEASEDDSKEASAEDDSKEAKTAAEVAAEAAIVAAEAAKEAAEAAKQAMDDEEDGEEKEASADDSKEAAAESKKAEDEEDGEEKEASEDDSKEASDDSKEASEDDSKEASNDDSKKAEDEEDGEEKEASEDDSKEASNDFDTAVEAKVAELKAAQDAEAGKTAEDDEEEMDEEAKKAAFEAKVLAEAEKKLAVESAPATLSGPNEMEIELTGSMDVLAPDAEADARLASIFDNDVPAELPESGQGSREASEKQGITQLPGQPKTASSAAPEGVDNLWKDAPDVSHLFQ